MARGSLGAVLLLALAGCGAAQPPHAAVEIAPALVLRSGGPTADEAARDAMQQADEQAWEYGRNDPGLNVGGGPPDTAVRYATIRVTERLSSSNGRPNEFSATYIRAVTER
jgi:hypothetical protein